MTDTDTETQPSEYDVDDSRHPDYDLNPMVDDEGYLW